jgi:hypothetical protein
MHDLAVVGAPHVKPAGVFRTGQCVGQDRVPDLIPSALILGRWPVRAADSLPLNAIAPRFGLSKRHDLRQQLQGRRAEALHLS